MNNKLRILIADDDDDDRDFLIQGLSECVSNLEIDSVSNGVECINTLKNNDYPDLIFLDLNMPLRSGLECLREMQNEGICSECRTIIHSTSHNLKDIRRASELGAAFYLVKPDSYSNLKQLLKVLFRMLELPLNVQTQKDHFVIAQDKLARVLNYYNAA